METDIPEHLMSFGQTFSRQMDLISNQVGRSLKYQVTLPLLQGDVSGKPDGLPYSLAPAVPRLEQ
jgi:hypothetical protein